MTTTKVISTYLAGGYVLAKATNLSITATGGVGPSGVRSFYDATIINDGLVNGGPDYFGVNFLQGKLVNGSATNTGAMIEGAGGVAGGYGSRIINYGTIAGVGEGAFSRGRITNFGSILSSGTNSLGVHIEGSALLINGQASNPAALIEGWVGVSVGTYGGTVINHGTISGSQAGVGVRVNNYDGGASIINGTPTDIAALIQGGQGVVLPYVAHVANFGTILGTQMSPASPYNQAAIEALYFDDLTNGSTRDHAATIRGYSGVYQYEGTMLNQGTISGTGQGGFGVRAAGALVNGNSLNHGALISGAVGVTDIPRRAQPLTIVNYGVIQGTAGTAVRFDDKYDLLVVEAGCAFGGAVLCGGGEVELASGQGTLSGFGAGSFTVSGSMAPATFQNVGTLAVDAGAVFVTTGAVEVAAGQIVEDFGSLRLGRFGGGGVVNDGRLKVKRGATLTISDVLNNDGKIIDHGGVIVVNRAVTGSGLVAIDAGTVTFNADFAENVRMRHGELRLGRSVDYAGKIVGFSSVGSLDLMDIGFIDAGEASFSGTSRGGVLTVTDGAHTARIALRGDYTADVFTAASDGNGGVTIQLAPAATSRPSPHVFAAAAATLGIGPPNLFAEFREVERSSTAWLGVPR